MLFKCSNHFSSLAGWRCTACGATLCAECTISGTTRLETCSRCGGFASLLKIPRGELHPFSAAQLLAAIPWPLTGAGMITIGASAVFVTVLGFFGGKGTIIAVGITVAYLFQIVRHTAHGHDDIPGPADFRNYFDDVIAPFLRLLLSLSLIWVPALVWTLWHRAPAPDLAEEQRRAISQAMRPGGPGLSIHGMRAVRTPNGIEVIEGNATPPPASPEQQEQLKAEEEEAAKARASAGEALAEPRPASRSPLVPIALVLLGVLIVPMSLIASALNTPFPVTANPVVLVGYALKLGRDYLLLVGFCLCAAVAALALQIAVHMIAGTGFLSRLPINFLTLAVAFVAFRAIGLLVRARGDDLGYGHEEFYLVPVLGDAQPRYVVREAKQVEPEAATPPALQAPAVQETPAAPPRAGPEMQPFPAEAFSLLAARQDVEGMLALLDKSAKDVPHSLLSAKAWMDLSGQAWQRRRGKAAAVALRRCLDAEPQGPLAPKAWLLAARVYAEALGDKTTSDRLLAELVKRFPDSEPGRIAAQRLAASAPSA